MSDSWGGTLLNISEYHRLPAERFFSEKELLPDPSTLSTVPETVLQGSGRYRKRRELTGYCTKATFDTLETDYYSGTAKDLQCDDGFSMSAIIEKFTSASRKLGSGEIADLVFFTLTFIEAGGET